MNYDEKESNLYEFCCGCIGVKISAPNELANGCFELDALVFDPCDGSDEGFNAIVKNVYWEKPNGEKSTPINKEKFINLKNKLNNQLVNGNKFKLIQDLIRS